MEKTKKKNAILRVAVVLFALTLLSTGLLGGTLAKYVTEGGAATSTARVAKWGVKIEATQSTDTLFKTQYLSTDSGYGTGKMSVIATADAGSGPDKVLAPGTKGSLPTISVSGEPEVACRVVISTSGSAPGWKVPDPNNSEQKIDYEPVEWTLKVGSTTPVDGGTFSNLTTALSKILEGGATKDYAPGTDLSDEIGDIEISWEWPFDDITNPGVNDANDTYLGNLTGNDVPKITLEFGITITQID